MPLTTDAAIRNVKPTDKPTKYPVGDGLYLLVTPQGQKWWRLRYRFDNKEKMIGLGVYPEISLKKATERRNEARRLLADGIDPS